MPKKIFLTIGALVIALISLPFWVPPLLDWNAFKETFERVVSDASGFEISLKGDINVRSIVPVLRVSVEEIEAISESPGEDPPISVDNVELEVGVWPLITGLLDIRNFHIDGLHVIYQIDQFGRRQAAKRVIADETKADAKVDATPARASFISDVRLANVRLTDSVLFYENKQTGQTIRAEDITINTQLAGLGSLLELSGTFIVNERPVSLTAGLETPKTLLQGNGARLVTKVESDILQADVDLETWIEPTLRVDGSIDLDIPAVGRFANWLGRPLKNAEDPGVLRLTGRISSTDAQTTLQNLTLSGDNWDLKASGEIDFAESPTRLSLNVEGSRIDLDRYLPKPIEAPRTLRLGGRQVESKVGTLDEPIDLSMLSDFRGEVRLALEALKVGGFEIGETSFRANLDDGVLEAELGELSLYGGRIIGLLSLDASGSGAAFDAKLAVDRVDLDSMHKTRETEAFTQGKLNGFVDLQSGGSTPRQLIQHLTGTVLLELDSQGEADTSEQILSRANAQLLIPGEDEAPYLLGRFIYAGQRVDVDIEAESLPKMVAGQTFGLDASILSKLMSLNYQGDIFQTPIFSLDGNLSASIPSAGQLASWLGSELPKDPGAVSVKAVFESDGYKGRILEARVQGDDLDAELKGDFDLSGAVSRFNLQAKTGVLRIDRYLPDSDGSSNSVDSKTASGSQTVFLIDELSTAALDFEQLRRLEVDVEIDSAGAVLPDLTVGRALFRADAENGKGNLTINQLDIDDGSVTGELNFDVSSATAALKLNLEGSRLNLDALAGLSQEGSKTTLGVADFNVIAETSGESQQALLANLAQAFEARLDSITVDERRSLDEVLVKISADSPGSDITLDMSGTLKDGAEAETHAVTIELRTDPVTDWLSDQNFTMQGSAQVGEFKLDMKSEVNHPITDLEPIVEINAEGESLAEIDAVLKAGLPVVGPYRLESRFVFNETQTEVSAFDLTLGQSRASGGVTLVTTEVRPIVTGQIKFDPLDLNEIAGNNVQQPATEQQSNGTGAAAEEEKWIFSEEPLPLEVLSSVDIPNLQLTFSKLHIAQNISIDDLRVEIVLENGNLRLAPLSGQLYDGKLQGEFEVSATEPNSIGLLLNGTGMDYGALLSALDITDEIHGRLNTHIELQGRGKSMRAIASSVSGRYELEAKDGQIDRDMLGILAFGSGTILGPLFGEDDAGNLRCIVTAIEFEDGIGDTIVQYYDTSFFAMGGEGKIDLKSETLDFIYNPKSSEVSLMKLAVPFRVSGPLRAPSVVPDTGGTLLTAAKTAATIGSFINPLVGLGVLAAGKITEDSDPCETARMIKRGEIPRKKKSDQRSEGLEQKNINK